MGVMTGYLDGDGTGNASDLIVVGPSLLSDEQRRMANVVRRRVRRRYIRDSSGGNDEENMNKAKEDGIGKKEDGEEELIGGSGKKTVRGRRSGHAGARFVGHNIGDWGDNTTTSTPTTTSAENDSSNENWGNGRRGQNDEKPCSRCMGTGYLTCIACSG